MHFGKNKLGVSGASLEFSRTSCNLRNLSVLCLLFCLHLPTICLHLSMLCVSLQELCLQSGSRNDSKVQHHFYM